MALVALGYSLCKICSKPILEKDYPDNTIGFPAFDPPYPESGEVLVLEPWHFTDSAIHRDCFLR